MSYVEISGAEEALGAAPIARGASGALIGSKIAANFKPITAAHRQGTAGGMTLFGLPWWAVLGAGAVGLLVVKKVMGKKSSGKKMRKNPGKVRKFRQTKTPAERRLRLKKRFRKMGLKKTTMAKMKSAMMPRVKCARCHRTFTPAVYESHFLSSHVTPRAY